MWSPAVFRRTPPRQANTNREAQKQTGKQTHSATDKETYRSGQGTFIVDDTQTSARRADTMSDRYKLIDRSFSLRCQASSRATDPGGGTGGEVREGQTVPHLIVVDISAVNSRGRRRCCTRRTGIQPRSNNKTRMRVIAASPSAEVRKVTTSDTLVHRRSTPMVQIDSQGMTSYLCLKSKNVFYRDVKSRWNRCPVIRAASINFADHI